MFESVEDVQQRFRDARYIANRRISTVVFLAARMGRPVLIEGPAGVGKTELAKTLADVTESAAHSPPVLRGARRGQGPLRVEVRQAAALHAAAARADRRDDRRRALAAGGGRPHRRPGRRVLLVPVPARRGRCCRRSASDEPVVLLVDEIDKAEPEFEAFLLEVLSDFQVSVPELGTIKAKHIPLVVLTSNNARELTRRPQAPLPAPLHRLPRAGRRAGDHPAQGAGGARAPGPGGGGRRAEDPRRSSCASRRRCRSRSTGRARWSSSTPRSSIPAWSSRP